MKKKAYLLSFAAAALFFAAALMLSAKYKKTEEQALEAVEADYKTLAEKGALSTPVLAEKDRDKAFENVLCSAVRVQADGHYGSGSIYKMLENEIIIVTNRHVLQYWGEGSSVTFFNQAKKPAALLKISDSADVGFLSVSPGDFSKEELYLLKNVKSDAQIQRNLKKNTCFFMIDMATKADEPVCYQGGVVSPKKFLPDFNGEMLYGDGYAVPGMSGCGIFDEYGNFIGMLAGSTQEGELAGVPGEIVEAAYQSIKKELQE